MGKITKPSKKHYNQTLVLDSGWMPRQIISSDRAFVVVYKGNARVVEEHPQRFGLVNRNIEIFKPSIIQVYSYIDLAYQKVPLTRENIFKRDEYKCAYCPENNRKLLTIDHIIPKSKGGPNTWENLITACKKCNGEKSDLTIEEYGHPHPRPSRPHYLMMLKRVNYIPEEWKKYLFY